MSSVGSLIILFGLSYLYGMTGTLNIAYLSASLSTATNSIWISFSLALIIGGMGLQSGMFPLHMWLPDAHSAAPAPVSAVLSGIVVKIGIYGLLRLLVLVFAPLSLTWQTTIAVFAVLTMFTGNFLALKQDDIKRLLASSTIANIGYILLGISIRSELAITGSLLHILNHAVTKALLFLSAGALIYGTNTKSIRKMAGVRHYMPVTSSLFLLAILSLTGIPPLNMFWSELTIVSAGLQSEMMIYSLLMILNLALASVYCIRIIKTVALDKPTASAKKSREVSKPLLIIISILAAMLLLVGFYPSPFMDFARNSAVAALDYQKYVGVVVDK
jgi:proton-translocating NADH-quinone oxidoreductase chain N